MMIGPNTHCLELCYDHNYKVYHEKHKAELMKAILYIKDTLPRTIINLILSPSM